VTTGARFLAARKLLCWPRDRLAPKAGISLTMLKRIEEGAYVPSIEQRSALRAALEEGGVEFTNGDTPGVRLKVKARKTT
jgi:ribosome-binding protein aMBF1 (putative translation factor)